MLLVCCLLVVKTLYYLCEIQSAVFSHSWIFMKIYCENNIRMQCSDKSQIFPVVSEHSQHFANFYHNCGDFCESFQNQVEPTVHFYLLFQNQSLKHFAVQNICIKTWPYLWACFLFRSSAYLIFVPQSLWTFEIFSTRMDHVRSS